LRAKSFSWCVAIGAHVIFAQVISKFRRKTLLRAPKNEKFITGGIARRESLDADSLIF
jgi:hypothetical protein